MRLRRAIALAGLLALVPRLGEAIDSESLSFRQRASGSDGGGRRSASASFRSDSTVADVAFTTATSASFRTRGGLIQGFFFPSPITSFVLQACATGEFVLTWTVPGNDGVEGARPRGYLVRYSTDAASAPFLSESNFFGADAAAGPAPGLRGSTQSVTLSNLDEAATYYIAIVALEADGTPAGLSIPTTGYPHATGGVLAAVTALSGFRRSLLSWSAPQGGGPSCVAVAYNLYRSTDAATYGFVAQASATAHTDLGVAAGTTYYYRVYGVNGGGDEFASNGTQVFVRTASPLSPVGVQVSSSHAVSWAHPLSFDFGEAFADPANLRADELSGFEVWRSSSPTGTWSLAVAVSTTATQWTDAAPGNALYYEVVGTNITERSAASLIGGAGLDSYVLAPGGSQLVLDPAIAQALASGKGFAVTASSTSYAGPVEGAPVYNDARFDVVAADGRRTPDFRFPVPARLRLAFRQQNGLLVAAAPQVGEATLYWNNGVQWTKLYGTLDGAGNVLAAPVQFGGEFQVRATARGTDFAFDSGGVSNRFLTPNADGVNDNVVFRFDNPRDSAVTGRIFDVRGGLVATLAQKDRYSMEWDGTAGGRAVPGGVYIYQLEGDGRRYAGTLVVIK